MPQTPSRPLAVRTVLLDCIALVLEAARESGRFYFSWALGVFLSKQAVQCGAQDGSQRLVTTPGQCPRLIGKLARHADTDGGLADGCARHTFILYHKPEPLQVGLNAALIKRRRARAHSLLCFSDTCCK